ncbi:MAG: hypothetical protein M0C28_07615 [Candidatus Moduliflexus flocculans]|nr:hypothetical protein [Candidatus Moduliflexus flocculans]
MPVSPTRSSRRASACSGRATPDTRTGRSACRAADAPRAAEVRPAGRYDFASPAPRRTSPSSLWPARRPISGTATPS